MPTIYFVCVGNTCRSPMAAEMMNQLLNLNGITNFRSDSFGVHPFYSDDVKVKGLRENAVQQVMGFIAGLRNHRPKGFPNVLLLPGDRMILLDGNYRNDLIQSVRERKTQCGSYPLIVMHTEDPFGGPIDDYIDCCREMKERIEQNLDVILGQSNS